MITGGGLGIPWMRVKIVPVEEANCRERMASLWYNYYLTKFGIYIVGNIPQEHPFSENTAFPEIECIKK